MVALHEIKRHQTHAVRVGNITIGGGAPVVVQSMTNTPTEDIAATVKQVFELWRAGSEIVRITVNIDEAAAAVPHIRDKLAAMGCDVPLAGCFHYNGHRLLMDHPACAEALGKYRINPGNVGFGQKRDKQFEQMIECAVLHKKPVRIGVNWGSLDEAVSARLMDENGKRAEPWSADQVMREALVQSCLESAAAAERAGMKPNEMVLSAKVSRVQDLIAVYQEMAKRSNYALHLGLTEAGMGSKGIVATTAALSVLLQQGIGDTIRASLTPRPGEAREQEVIVCTEILQTLGLRSFAPQVSACPGCGRTTSTVFQSLAEKIQTYLRDQMPVWKENYTGVEAMSVAVMGCIVNGPGESKHADIGISLPGTGEQPTAPVFIDGEKRMTLHGADIAEQFQKIVEDYVQNRYGNKGKAA